MGIFVIGLNHHECPVAIREKLHFSPSVSESVLGRFKEISGLTELLILSTCNRVELYGFCEEAVDAKEKAKHLFKAAAVLSVKAGLVGAAFMLGGGPVLLSFPNLFQSVLSTADLIGESAIEFADSAIQAISDTLADENKIREHVASVETEDEDA